MRLPSNNGKWNVSHGKDFFADIVATKNLNFDNEGFISVSRNPMVLKARIADNFGILQAVAADETLYYLITSRGYYSLDVSSGVPVFTELNNMGQPTATAGIDGVIFAGVLVVTGTTMVRSYSSPNWTDQGITISASYPHPLCVDENRNEIAVANGNVLKTYNTAFSLQNTLTIPAQHVITTVRYRQNKYYIGTRNISGGNAKMFVWNGTGTSAEAQFDVHCDWLYSLADFDSSICAVVSSGQILRFNGGGFDELDHFPVYDTQYSWVSNASVATGAGKVLNRGMLAVGDDLYLNIDGSLRTTDTYPGAYLSDQPSGLWCLDKSVGLYHKNGLNYKKFAAKSVSSLASGNLVFATAHDAETGDAVTASTISSLTGISANTTYFVIKVSTTTLKLAISPADAAAGNAITLGGSVTSEALTFYPANSFGSTRADGGPAAIGMMNFNIPKAFYGLGLLIGGRLLDNANATVECIQTEGLARGRGYFVTSPIPASGIADLFQKLFMGIHEMNFSTDSIVIKYRKLPRLGLPTPLAVSAGGLATWVNGTSFTIDTTLKDFKSALVGDEIEILSGVGSGVLTHITAINSASNPYTVTIQDTVLDVVAADVSEVSADNWTLLGSISSTSNNVADSFAEYPIAKESGMLQFKIELRGGVMLRYVNFVQRANKQAQ